MSIIDRIEQRFVSGNSVPVSRAHITRDEWTELCALARGGLASPRGEAVAWAGIRKSFVSMMAKIDQRFRSGNNVPVERAHITAIEWQLMNKYEEACENLVTTVCSRDASPPSAGVVTDAVIDAMISAHESANHGTRAGGGIERGQREVEMGRKAMRAALQALASAPRGEGKVG